jgi:hypothetical protein
MLGRRCLQALAVTAVLAPVASHAATQENFLVRTTRDLVELCSAGPTHPLRDQAVHFCHGFLVGAFQYHISVFPTSGPGALFCLPNPPPSRDAAISTFVAWAKANPQYLDEKPTDTEFRWLAIAYPCRQ